MCLARSLHVDLEPAMVLLRNAVVQDVLIKENLRGANGALKAPVARHQDARIRDYAHSLRARRKEALRLQRLHSASGQALLSQLRLPRFEVDFVVI